jgi:hypothetical protein
MILSTVGVWKVYTHLMTHGEATARMIKATKLATVLIAHRAEPAVVAAMPEAGRRLTATLAGTRSPSETTWALVTDLVEAHDAGLVKAAG